MSAIKDKKSGEVIDIKNNIEVFAIGYTIIILELQLEGGKIMSAKDFVNGRKIEKGMILGEK